MTKDSYGFKCREWDIYKDAGGFGKKIGGRGSKSGFTILELVLYLLIFAVLGTLALAVLNFAIKGKLAVGKLGEVQLDTERALAQMVEKTHSSLSINGASSTLNLAMSSSTINPTVFGLSAGAITVREGSGSAVSTTPSTLYVTSLVFTKITNNAPSTSSVQIQITAEYNNYGTVDTSTVYSVQTTAMPI